MSRFNLEKINDKHLSGKDKSKMSITELRLIEDKNDLSALGWIAAEETKKGFERAKKALNEMIFVQNGKLIRKRPGKPNQVISRLEERKVEIGKTISI